MQIQQKLWYFSASLILLGSALSGSVDAGESQFTSVLVAIVDSPIFVTHAPDDLDRIFVVGQYGLIFIIKDGTVLDDPFLDVSDLILSNANTRGLLGLAFHPQYATNGFLYVFYTSQPDGDVSVVRFEVTNDPDIADPASAHAVLAVPHPGFTHHGGWIGFGPNDGYLYVAIGDGGGWYDPDDNAQNLDVLLGKLLRLDVDGDDFRADPNRNYAIPPDNPFVGVDGADEIWAYGLRQPWRCSFDRETGDLYIGDVGQWDWEEVNFQPAESFGGENYGWNCKEAHMCTDEKTCDCKDPSLVDPIFVYENPVNASTAVIGGYVYRGCAISSLVGAYVVADYRANPIWQFRYDGQDLTDLEEIQDDLDPGDGLSIDPPLSSFGEDVLGELYICERGSGEIFKIVLAGEPSPDCNGNGVSDACDIASGTSSDDNNNGIPDECEAVPCPWDLDNNGDVGTSDLLALLASWGKCEGCPADFGGDSNVDLSDLLVLIANWGPCP